MHRSLCTILLMTCLLQACHTPGEATTGSSAPANNSMPKAVSGSSILSVILKVQASGSGVVFEIGQVSVKEGTYKHNVPNSDASWYKACFTDKVGRVMDSSLFENPLAARMEAVKDDGGLVTTTNKKSESAVYIRAKYNSAMVYLLLYDNKGKKLNTFNLETYLK